MDIISQKVDFSPVLPNFYHPQEKQICQLQPVVSSILGQSSRDMRALRSPFTSCTQESTSYAAALVWGQKKGLGGLEERIMQIHWSTYTSVRVFSMTLSHRKRVCFVTRLAHLIRPWVKGYFPVFWKVSYFKPAMYCDYLIVQLKQELLNDK